MRYAVRCGSSICSERHKSNPVSRLTVRASTKVQRALLQLRTWHGLLLAGPQVHCAMPEVVLAFSIHPVSGVHTPESLVLIVRNTIAVVTSESIRLARYSSLAVLE